MTHRTVPPVQRMIVHICTKNVCSHLHMPTGRIWRTPTSSSSSTCNLYLEYYEYSTRPQSTSSSTCHLHCTEAICKFEIFGAINGVQPTPRQHKSGSFQVEGRVQLIVSLVQNRTKIVVGKVDSTIILHQIFSDMTFFWTEKATNPFPGP